MQQLLLRLRDELSRFVAQREAALLAVDCRDEDVPFVMKTMSDLDREDESNLYLLALHDFFSAATYVDGVVHSVNTEMSAIAEALATEGLAGLAPLPARVTDPAIPPAHRLIELFEHVRSWIPSGALHRVIWCLLPGQIADAARHAKLLQDLLGHENQMEPWMRATRVVARVPGGSSQLGSSFRYVRRFRTDFSPAAIESALLVEAEDENLTVSKRAQALLTLAQLDSAHGRADDARRRFGQVLRHAEESQNSTMAALALCGLGELAHRRRELSIARKWYECAVEPVCATKAPVLLAMLSRNLGDLSFLEARFTEAETHYQAWQQLATHLLDAEGRLQALQKLALCQLRQARMQDARQNLETAATLGRSLDLNGLHRYTLEELLRLYEAQGEVLLHRQVGDELRALPVEESAHVG